MVEETIEVEAEEGSPSDLAEGPISLAIGGGRWAASDGKRVVAGDASDLAALAQQLRERPLVAHDVKSLGGHGPDSLLAAAQAGGARSRPRHDGRRLPDRSRSPHLRAARARRRRRPGGRARGRRGGPAVAGGRGGRRGGRPGRRRPARRRAGRAPARAPHRVRRRAAAQRGRDAVDRGARRDGADRARARHRAPRRDRLRDGGADRPARARDLRAGRARVHDRLPAAAGDRVLRRARPDQEATREDRLLDRRARARPDCATSIRSSRRSSNGAS